MNFVTLKKHQRDDHDGGLFRVVRIYYLQFIPVQASVSWRITRLDSDFLRSCIQICPPTEIS